MSGIKRWVILANLLFALGFALTAMADDPKGKPGIDEGLFDGLPPTPAAKVTEEAAAPVLPGEDIDLGGLKDPFARIAGKMQRSQQALKAGDSKDETQGLQKEILTDLDALLKSLEKK